MEPPSISEVLNKTTQPLHSPDMPGLNSLMGPHSDSIRAPSPTPRDAALDSCSDFPPLLTANRPSKRIAPPPISSITAPGRTDLGASEVQAHANIPPHGLELNKQQVAVFMQPPGSVLNDAQLQQMAVAKQPGPGNSEFSRPYMDALAPRKTNTGSCCYFWD